MKTAFLLPALAVMLAAPAARAGLYAHYSFDAGFNDISGNNRNGTLVDAGTTGDSSITTTAGEFKFGGGAMSFGGNGDRLDLPATYTFSSGTPYTIAFWARDLTSATSNNGGMVIGDRNNNNFFLWIDTSVSGGGLRWRSSSSVAERQADFTFTLDGEWHHYVIQAGDFDDADTTVNEIRLYRDGTVVGTATGKQTGFQFNCIGQAYTTAAFSFRGQIDELWIFDEVLSAAAIAALQASNDPFATPAYAGFHHRYDGDFSDSSGHNNGGTPAGAAAITTDETAIAAGSGALALDGADTSRVALVNPGSYNATQPWTIAFWAKRETSQLNKGMVIGTAANTSDFIWLNDNFTGLRFRSSTNTTLDFTAPKDSALRHYALVADGTGSLALYLDGQLSETLTGNTAFAFDSIGMAYPTTGQHYNFMGSLDEVHVLGSALDATAVAQMYASEKPAIPVTRLRIVLLAGQSNADGRADTSELPTSPVNLQAPQPDVDLFYRVEGGSPTLTTLRPGLSETGQFGPEITLGRRLADLHQTETGTRVAIIKYANGGTNLAVEWKAGGDSTTTGDGPEYVTFQETVTAGLAALAAAYPRATLDLQGLVWMQGESDAVSGYASSYQANLAAFIADVRVTYGANLPFVIARLSSGQTALTSSYLNQVRAAQDAVAAADPRTTIFSTDSYGLKSDNLHFVGSGLRSMGDTFATETAYNQWMVETFPAADIDAGRAEPEADYDGDGFTNRSEFLAATNPLAPTSAFQAAAQVTAGNVATISYATSSARFYQVERFDEATSSWQPFLPALRGTGTTEVRSLGAISNRGMYRVRTSLP